MISSPSCTKCFAFLEIESFAMWYSLTIALLVGSPFPSGKRVRKTRIANLALVNSLKDSF